MSATPDSALADSEQLVADLQRQLAECRAERDEALQRETATAEVLQVINSSPGDLTPVFDAMLEKATRLCEAPFGHLRTWDGERFHLGAAHGEPEFCEWFWQRGPIRPDRDAPLGRILAGERVVHFADAPGDEGYQTSAGFRDMAEASGIRSAIWVALHKDDALLGTITVYRKEVRPFTDKQIALLQNFAAQAVIAMENARLLTETREALEQQTATAEVLQVINSSPGDLGPVFDAMLEKAVRLCDSASGTMLRWDGERLHRVAWLGVPPEHIEATWQPVTPRPGTPGYRIVQGENVVCIADLAEEVASGRGPPVRSQAHFGGRSYVAVALRKDDRLLEVISIFRQEVRPFSEKQIALLQNFAAQR